MGDFLDNVTDKIPEIWFDLYARLIPGVIGIFLIVLFLLSRDLIKQIEQNVRIYPIKLQPNTYILMNK